MAWGESLNRSPEPGRSAAAVGAAAASLRQVAREQEVVPVSVEVKLPTVLRTHADGQASINSDGATVGGSVVSYNGHQYSAKWWTQGEQPDTHSGPNDVWQDKGPCSGSGSPSPTGSPSKSPSGSPSTSPTPSGSSQYPAWQANHAYATGDRVSYAGHNYQCLQAHTSQVGWEPPNVPALWQALS